MKIGQYTVCTIPFLFACTTSPPLISPSGSEGQEVTENLEQRITPDQEPATASQPLSPPSGSEGQELIENLKQRIMLDQGPAIASPPLSPPNGSEGQEVIENLEQRITPDQGPAIASPPLIPPSGSERQEVTENLEQRITPDQEPATASPPLSPASGSEHQEMTDKELPDANVPVRGMTQREVEQEFGAPQKKLYPVGNPPITRWIYPDYTVYFERQYLIRAVFSRMAGSTDPVQ